MSPLAIVKTEVPDRPSDRMGELLERRDALHTELSRLSKPEATRSAAAAGVAAAEDEIRRLDIGDRDGWARWAADPSGDPPAPRHEERRALEQRRALAVADLRGAEAAVAGVQGRQVELIAELQRIGPQLFAIRLESILVEVPEIERKIHEAIQAQSEGLLKLRGLHTALAEEKSGAITRGDESSAAAIQAAMARIEDLKRPAVEQNYASMLTEVAKWRERFR